MDIKVNEEELLSFAYGEEADEKKNKEIEESNSCMQKVNAVRFVHAAFLRAKEAEECELSESEKNASYVRLLEKMRYKKYLNTSKTRVSPTFAAAAAAVFIVFSLIPRVRGADEEKAFHSQTEGKLLLSSFEEPYTSLSVSPSFFERERGTLVLTGNIQEVASISEKMDCAGLFEAPFPNEEADFPRVVLVNPLWDTAENENISLPLKSIKEQLE